MRVLQQSQLAKGVEEAMQVADLPLAVKSAIEKKYPGASLRKAEKIVHQEQVAYEVALAKASKKEVLLTPAGKIIREE